MRFVHRGHDLVHLRTAEVGSGFQTREDALPACHLLKVLLKYVLKEGRNKMQYTKENKRKLM